MLLNVTLRSAYMMTEKEKNIYLSIKQQHKCEEFQIATNIVIPSIDSACVSIKRVNNETIKE